MWLLLCLLLHAATAFAEAPALVQGGSEEEVFRAWGRAHAIDRLWQMDFLRMTAHGQRAELVGWKAIETDFSMRLLGIKERAEVIYTELGPRITRLLEAYSSGVNAGTAEGFENGRYAFERWGGRTRASQVAPWQGTDTIALLLLQSFDQTRKTFGTELTEAARLEKYPSQMAAWFDPDRPVPPPWDTAILKKGEYSHIPATIPPETQFAATNPWPHADLAELPISETGSNNWVVGPGRSKTGSAWLANDPHLDLRYPATWHWVRLLGAGFNALGASLPGIPLIPSGTNTHVAWGLTNAYLNVADLVAVPEKELRDSVKTRPTIWVRAIGVNFPFFFKSFERTASGRPVLPVPGPPGKKLVLDWSAFKLNGTFMRESLEGFIELMQSPHARAADQGLAKIKVPAWNFVFADTQGTIGYRAVGMTPRHLSGTSPARFGVTHRTDLREWEKERDSIPMLSADEMPHVFKPKRGYVVTANNRHWPRDSTLEGGRSFSDGFRAFRIEELLTTSPKHDLASLQKIQCDTQAVDARFLLPGLLKVVDPTWPTTQKLRQWLDSGTPADLDCRVCGLYRRWIDHLFEDYSLNEIALFRILTDLQASKAPEWAPRIQKALAEAQEDLQKHKALFAPWGEHHCSRFDPLSEDSHFFEQCLATPGDKQSVNPGSLKYDSKSGRFLHTSGASQRLIVELTDPPTVYAIVPGTQKDGATRDLQDLNSPWNLWARCQLQKLDFP